MNTVLEIEKAIEQLPTGQMLEIAEWLDTQLRPRLDFEEEKDVSQLSPAWRKELERRVESIRQGTSRSIPHDEVMAEIHHVLSLAPPPRFEKGGFAGQWKVSGEGTGNNTRSA